MTGASPGRHFKGVLEQEDNLQFRQELNDRKLGRKTNTKRNTNSFVLVLEAGSPYVAKVTLEDREGTTDMCRHLALGKSSKIPAQRKVEDRLCGLKISFLSFLLRASVLYNV